MSEHQKEERVVFKNHVYVFVTLYLSVPYLNKICQNYELSKILSGFIPDLETPFGRELERF